MEPVGAVVVVADEDRPEGEVVARDHVPVDVERAVGPEQRVDRPARVVRRQARWGRRTGRLHRGSVGLRAGRRPRDLPTRVGPVAPASHRGLFPEVRGWQGSCIRVVHEHAHVSGERLYVQRAAGDVDVPLPHPRRMRRCCRSTPVRQPWPTASSSAAQARGPGCSDCGAAPRGSTRSDHGAMSIIAHHAGPGHQPPLVPGVEHERRPHARQARRGAPLLAGLGRSPRARGAWRCGWIPPPLRRNSTPPRRSIPT